MDRSNFPVSEQCLESHPRAPYMRLILSISYVLCMHVYVYIALRRGGWSRFYEHQGRGAIFFPIMLWLHQKMREKWQISRRKFRGNLDITTESRISLYADVGTIEERGDFPRLFMIFSIKWNSCCWYPEIIKNLPLHLETDFSALIIIIRLHGPDQSGNGND